MQYRNLKKLAPRGYAGVFVAPRRSRRSRRRNDMHRKL